MSLPSSQKPNHRVLQMDILHASICISLHAIIFIYVNSYVVGLLSLNSMYINYDYSHGCSNMVHYYALYAANYNHLPFFSNIEEIKFMIFYVVFVQ